jgi:DNA-binding beta-propeller fold protein YncE
MNASNESRRRSRRLACTAIVAAIALCGALTTGSAQAARSLLAKNVVKSEETPKGQIEGACGVAVTSERIFVSSYYAHAVVTFNSSGSFISSQTPVADNGPCGLAVSAGGDLYANVFHERVLGLPLQVLFDEAESTGVAVDQASGDVYVNDRTYVAAYTSTGILIDSQIGLGTLGDGYGVAAAGGRVYVPDAADRTVKVYEPALDKVNPVQIITGSATPQNGFKSLVDAAIAIDPTNGHVLVLDNLQPNFEQPQGAVDEFSETGVFLGQLTQFIDAEPSGLAFDGTGNLFLTSGNGEKATVLKFGPYAETAALISSAPVQAAAPAVPPQEAAAPAAIITAAASAAVPPPRAPRRHKHSRDLSKRDRRPHLQKAKGQVR